MKPLSKSDQQLLEQHFYNIAPDWKDTETQKHCMRVAVFSLHIGRAVGLAEEQVKSVGRAAFLHDIGKMATPEAILRKPSALNPEELAIMRKHPYDGYQLLKKTTPLLDDAAEIVYAHHENFDGTGYPRGLKGEEIPFGARIVAVANTWDSITSDLPYRKAKSLDAADEELQRCRGRQLDPTIVDTVLNMPEDFWVGIYQDIKAVYNNISILQITPVAIQ